MKTLRQVGNWKLVLDLLMEVTAIVNENINFQSDWNTGYEAQEEYESIKRMSDDEFISYCVNMIPLPFEDCDMFDELDMLN